MAALPGNPTARLHAVYTQLDEATACPVCLDGMRDPVITRCGHTFCRQCIMASVQAGFGCPYCRKACSFHHLTNNNFAGDVRTQMAALQREIGTTSRAFAALQQEAWRKEQRCQQLQQELCEQRSLLEDHVRFTAALRAERSEGQKLRGRAAANEEALLRLMGIVWKHIQGQNPEEPHSSTCSMCNMTRGPATGVTREFGTVCECRRNSGDLMRGGIRNGSMGLKISPDLKWDMNIHEDWRVGSVSYEERVHAAGRAHVEGESVQFTDGMMWESRGSGGSGSCRKRAIPSFSGRLCGVEGASLMVLSGFPGGGGVMIENPGEHFASYRGAAAACDAPEAAAEEAAALAESSSPSAKAAAFPRGGAPARPTLAPPHDLSDVRSAVCRWGTPDSPESGWQWNPGESQSL